VYDGTHALQLRETTRGGTNIGELKIAFDGLDAYDAPVDIMVQKSPSQFEVLGSALEIS
jgi:hypothetical protein